MKNSRSEDVSDRNLPLLMRKTALAKRLCVSTRTIGNWMAARVIPFYKIKRVTLFDFGKVMDALSRFERVEVRANVKLRR